MRGVVLARIAADPLDVADCARAVWTHADGAAVTFAGVVRDHDGGRGVTALEYTAHPDAEAALQVAAERVAQRHPAVAIAVAHRVGALRIGDVALACAVVSAHRAEAFAACADLVDEVKGTVPIWKEQHFADGTSEWVGSP